MDLSSLRMFVAVVEEGGITRAAERLGRVQSNVTTRIRQLEEDLRAELFLRQGKRLILAPAGRVLIDYARRILALAEEARNAVGDGVPRGLFRLGSMESTAAVRLPGPLAVFSQAYPAVKLEIRTGNPVQLSQAVLDGEVDAALIAEPFDSDRFDALPAFDEEPVIVTTDRDAPIDAPESLAATSLPGTALVFEQGCPHRRRLEDWYSARGQRPERIVEMGSYHAMLGCVLAGMGAALLPRSVLETFPEARRLRVHPLPDERYRLGTWLIWRKGIPTPNVRALADILEADRPQSSGVAP